MTPTRDWADEAAADICDVIDDLEKSSLAYREWSSKIATALRDTRKEGVEECAEIVDRANNGWTGNHISREIRALGESK